MQQRSPVIFWLLLAATISVDAVAAYWITDTGFDAESATLYLSLAFGELSVLSAWVVLFRKRMARSWLLPFIVALLIAVNITYTLRPRLSFDMDELYAFAGLMWAHVATVLIVLWLLKPTRLFAGFADQAGEMPWQFSTGHLLVVMTCSSIMLVVLGKAGLLLDDDLGSFVMLLVGNAILLVAVGAAVQSHSQWLMRLAASLGSAFLVAAVCEWTDAAVANDLNLAAYNLIQSMVMWLWLELIRPPRCVEVAGGEEPKPLAPAP